MNRLLIIGFLSGAGAVAFGAFGAHALEPLLIEAGRLETYHTAVNYHYYHTFGIIIIGLTVGFTRNKKLEIAGWLMSGGMLLFSGSLYLLCLTGFKFWIWVIPIGGVLLIFSWLFAAFLFWKGQRKTQ